MWAGCSLGWKQVEMSLSPGGAAWLLAVGWCCPVPRCRTGVCWRWSSPRCAWSSPCPLLVQCDAVQGSWNILVYFSPKAVPLALECRAAVCPAGMCSLRCLYGLLELGPELCSSWEELMQALGDISLLSPYLCIDIYAADAPIKLTCGHPAPSMGCWMPKKL